MSKSKTISYMIIYPKELSLSISKVEAQTETVVVEVQTVTVIIKAIVFVIFGGLVICMTFLLLNKNKYGIENYRFRPDLWARRPTNSSPERREQALRDCRRNQNTRINSNNTNNTRNSVQFTVSQDHQNGTLIILENSGDRERDRNHEHEDPPPPYENPPSYQQVIDEWIEKNGNLI